MGFMTSKQIGIDLGTSNTVVYLKGSGIIMRAPSVVAVNKQTKEVVAVGSEAKRMLGKTPDSIVAHRPLKGSVVADYEITARMLQTFFNKIQAGTFFSHPVIIIGVPYGVTEVERRAVIGATYDAGAKEAIPAQEPVVAAIGAGLRVDNPKGCIIVDIGGGTTKTAVMSLGSVVVSRSARVAGDTFDIAIMKYLKDKKGILVGETTAEALKIQIGSVHKSTDKGQLQIFGRSTDSGQAFSTTVKSFEIRAALEEQMETVAATIKATLEGTPPELASDICDFGMMLMGGGALLAGLSIFLKERTGLRVTLAKNPMDCVCLGIGRILEGPEDFRQKILNLDR